MPQVRMLQAVAGPDFSWLPGEVVEMNAEQARSWADGIRGELVRDEPVATPENAADDHTGQLETAATTTRRGARGTVRETR